MEASLTAVREDLLTRARMKLLIPSVPVSRAVAFLQEHDIFNHTTAEAAKPVFRSYLVQGERTRVMFVVSPVSRNSVRRAPPVAPQPSSSSLTPDAGGRTPIAQLAFADDELEFFAALQLDVRLRQEESQAHQPGGRSPRLTAAASTSLALHSSSSVSVGSSNQTSITQSRVSPPVITPSISLSSSTNAAAPVSLVSSGAAGASAGDVWRAHGAASSGAIVGGGPANNLGASLGPSATPSIGALAAHGASHISASLPMLPTIGNNQPIQSNFDLQRSTARNVVDVAPRHSTYAWMESDDLMLTDGTAADAGM